jgi:hypothetical protein
MAAEAPPAPVGFNIDGDSFEFCGGSGVETVGEENQSLIGHIVKSLVRFHRPRTRFRSFLSLRHCARVLLQCGRVLVFCF